MTTRAKPTQMGLFGADERKVDSAGWSEATEQLASQLPSSLYLGTSSWTFPGWKGILYEGAVTEKNLSREGLRAYAEHPLLRCAGIDRTYYRPISADDFRAYADQVPEDFRFVVKAHDFCTMRRFPDHPRYGQRAGRLNRYFLNAPYAVEEVIGPYSEGLGRKAALLLFQFSPNLVEQEISPPDFADQLDTFLKALPKTARYGVEIRHSAYLTDHYARVLKESSCTHCLTVHPMMPPLVSQVQAIAAAPSDQTLIRWMLGHGRTYQAARERYHPFSQLLDTDPENRSQIAELSRRSLKRASVFVLANNKAEGCAPLSIFRLAEQIVRGT